MSRDALSNLYESFHASRAKRGTVGVRARIDFICEEVGQGQDVIELGCRDGSLLQYFCQGNRVIGCDIDRRALTACSARFGIETRVANLNEPLPFPDAAVDVVVLSEVLEHLPYPDITLAEIARILRPTGRLVGSVPNAVRFRNRLRFMLTGRVESDPMHLHHFGRSSLQRLLAGYFDHASVREAAGRFAVWSPRLFANVLLFRGLGPSRRQDAVLG